MKTMPTRNVNLTAHLDSFVEASVASGRYQNASEVVREGLRLLERQQREDEQKLARLLAAIDVAEAELARGESIEVSADELPEYLASLGASARRDIA